jgi:hypothetical protein
LKFDWKSSKTKKVALLAVLTAIPTATGYILGPLSSFINLSFKLMGIPFGVKLGFASLVLVTILARSYLGRGAATTEGLLLGITAIFFHVSEPPTIRIPKDLLLGVGVDIALFKSSEVDIKSSIFASIIGGALSYVPYLLILPVESYTTVLLLTIVLVAMSGYLISCAMGGFVAGLVLKNLPDI